MYLAEYIIGGTAWLQAAAELSYPNGADGQQAQRWWTRFRTLLRNLDIVPQVSASLRVQLGVQLEAALFIVAPGAQIELLRRAVGSFTQLDIVADGEVKYARDRVEHDRLLRFPRFQCRVAMPPLGRGETWFAFDYRIHDHLNELFLEAQVLQHTLGYHINIEPLGVSAEWLRQAARNALRVSETDGVPPSLDQLQRDLAEKLRHTTHVCEELLGIDTLAAWDWLRGRLERLFRQRYGNYVPVELQVDQEGHEGSLTATRHKAFFETLGVDEICSGAVTAAEHTDFLAWQPARELLDLMPKTSRVAQEADKPRLLDYAGMPQPYSGRERYLFISYTHQDLERFKLLLTELSRRGHRIWYDKGIPGGAEWDSLIEERLQHCEALLVFLSKAAVRSKYVRREVKFADTLSKPVVAVRLEDDINLANGMAMLFNQYQVLDGAASSLGDDLEWAVRSARDV